MYEAAALALEKTYRTALSDYLHDGDESHLNEAYEFGYETLESGHSLVELINFHCTALTACLREGDISLSATEAAAAAGRMLMQATAPFNILQMTLSENNSALRRLNAVFEESTNRFAHALHDDAGQMLSVAYLELSQLRDELPESSRERLDRLCGYLDQTREQLRHLSHELRPPMLEHMGLLPSIRNLVNGFRQKYGLDISLDVPDIKREVLGAVELPLYRTIHESLTNIVRHADAKQVWITLRAFPDRVDCSVLDNGIGFDTDLAISSGADRGLGLINLSERIAALQGTVEIDSRPGRGSCIRVSLPLTV